MLAAVGEVRTPTAAAAAAGEPGGEEGAFTSAASASASPEGYFRLDIRSKGIAGEARSTVLRKNRLLDVAPGVARTDCGLNKDIPRELMSSPSPPQTA